VGFIRVLDPVSTPTEAYQGCWYLLFVQGVSTRIKVLPDQDDDYLYTLALVGSSPTLVLQKAHECGLLNQTHYNIFLSEIHTYIVYFNSCVRRVETLGYQTKSITLIFWSLFSGMNYCLGSSACQSPRFGRFLRPPEVKRRHSRGQ
jgi:hypothetical protein